MGVVGADLGGTLTATRMVGGFILVAFLFSILLAWPGRRRWPWWLIGGLCASISGTLAFSLPGASRWWLDPIRPAAFGLAVTFLALATLRDLKDPGR